MILTLCKAFIVGLVASMTLGPSMFAVIRKTLEGGRTSGFVCALGVTLSDTIYSVLGVLCLGYVQGFLAQHSQIVNIVGGILVIGIGLFLYFNKVKAPAELSGNFRSAGFVQTFLIAFLNAGSAAIMFAYLAIAKAAEIGLWASVGVCAGSVTWWLFVTWGISRLGNRFKFETLARICKILAIVIIVLGVLWELKTLLGIGS